MVSGASIPGAFVAAETAGASGRDFLTGLAAGYEVMERMAADFIPTVMARGFAFEMLQDLARAGLATAHRDAVGASKTKVAHLRITAAGRSAITR